MATDTPDPYEEKKVTSVPLPDDSGETVVAQENMSPQVAAGGGEWPLPDAAPMGPAPGSGGDPEEGPADGHDVSETRQTGAGVFPTFREALEEDPVTGGSSSVPDEDEPA